MKKIIFLFLFLSSYFINAQNKSIYTGKIDSVVIENYSYYDKETSTINDTLEKNNTTLISSKQITKKEIEILNNKVKLIKSYSKKRSLLSHFNIIIIYYFNNKIVQNIIYSTITKNLTIYKLGENIFNGQATPYLENEIIKLSELKQIHRTQLKCNKYTKPIALMPKKPNIVNGQIEIFGHTMEGKPASCWVDCDENGKPIEKEKKSIWKTLFE